MNTFDHELSPQVQVDAVCRLLKEYADKLCELSRRLFEIPQRGLTSPLLVDMLQSESIALIEMQRSVIGPIKAVSLMGKRLIAAGGLEPIAELELKLRIDEVDRAVDEVDLATDTLKYRYSQFLPRDK